MFKIVDLYSHEVICVCETKTEVLLACDRRKRPHKKLFMRNLGWPTFADKVNFSELNITGKDIHPCAQERMFRVNGLYTSRQVPNYAPVLRRYQVLDEQGRSMDIRQWTEEINAVEEGHLERSSVHTDQADPEFRKDPIEGTDKIHRRRVSGYAMWHSTAAQNEGLPYMEECEGYAPIINHGRPRKRPVGLKSQWDQYEQKLNSRDRLRKSWKDNTKGCRQWAKNAHMTRSDKQEARNQKASDLYLQDPYADDFANIFMIMAEEFDAIWD